MAKGLRSNIRRRWRALRRNIVDQQKNIPDLQQLQYKLQCTIQGVQYREQSKPNAFLHPNNPNAEFPQYTPMKNIDFRCQTIPEHGFEFSGAHRKKQKEIKESPAEFIPNPDFEETSGSGELINELENILHMEIKNQEPKKKKKKQKSDGMDVEPIKATKKINKKGSKCKRSSKLVKF